MCRGIRRDEDVLFKGELDNLPATVKVVHVMSCPGENCTCEKGHITADIIKKYTENIIDDLDVYFCGPPLMVKGVIKSLRELNVKSRRIHYEKFSI